MASPQILRQTTYPVLRKPLALAAMLLILAGTAWPEKPLTQAPFIYGYSNTADQTVNEGFREEFDTAVPDLFHADGDMRYLGRYGFGCPIYPSRERSYETYLGEMKDHLAFLRGRGIERIIPYLCNQSIFGNTETRLGAWEIYDRWEDFESILPFPKPPDPITWMQREPNGDLHYNYSRLWARNRRAYDGLGLIRYAPCPNNPYWRAFCNNEARLAASLGFDGLFIDNCIIHCYCDACQERFQTYLKRRYTPAQLAEAFGNADYADITLYHEGDIRHWAQAQPGFIPWLEAKFPPDERAEIFGTSGPLDSQQVANAGGGMIMGQASAFVAERLLPPDIRPSFENLRLANPALQTPAGRLRWAETTRFWAGSIGEMLAELRDAGRPTNPDFFVVPNWGTMQRINAAAGRAEDGRDLRRMRNGAPWQMLEEGFTTGRIAPGLILEYDLELRFAFANRVRPMLLPYNLPGRDIYEVAMAETAASGGGAYVGRNAAYPEVQNAYQRFFRAQADLYEGYQSAARVALAHFFDQVHFLNLEHLREVHALNRCLADQQIPFDHLTEEGLENGQIDDYQVVILPNIAFLSDEQLDALRAYLRNGGILLTIGETASHDAYCRPREGDPFEGFPEDRLIRFTHLDDALSQPGIYLEPVVQAAEEGTFAETYADPKLGKYKSLSELDQKLWVKRYQAPGRFTEALAGLLGSAPRIADPRKAAGVRCLVYQRHDDDGRRLVVHLVNKNVPMAVPEEERVLQPVENLELYLPAPSGADALPSANLFVPGRPARTLEVHRAEPGQLQITVPSLHAYAVVALTLSKP